MKQWVKKIEGKCVTVVCDGSKKCKTVLIYFCLFFLKSNFDLELKTFWNDGGICIFGNRPVPALLNVFSPSLQTRRHDKLDRLSPGEPF